MLGRYSLKDNRSRSWKVLTPCRLRPYKEKWICEPVKGWHFSLNHTFLLRWKDSAVTVGELTTELNNWNEHKNFAHHGKLNQHWDLFFFYSFSLIIFGFILRKSMLRKGRRKGLFCLLWGTKVNTSLGYIQRSGLFGWQEQYRKSWCSFWGENNSPYTASLLLTEILEICSTEGKKKSQPSFWESVRAWLCVCVLEMKGIIVTSQSSLNRKD